MTQPDLRTLAQQGNPDAIALWLNHTLQPRGVTAKVLIRADLLKILLIADRPLEQQALVELIGQQICDLEPPNLQRIKIYAQLSRSDRSAAPLQRNHPIWIAELSLSPSRSASKALVPVSADSKALEPISDRNIERSQPRKGILLTLVFPYQEIFRSAIYQRSIVRLLLFLGLLPLAVNLLAEQITLAQTAWLTGMYYAIVWGLLLHVLIQPAQVSWKKTIACVLLTVFISIPVLLLVQRVPPFRALYAATGQAGLGQLIGFVLGVGVLEEVCKAIPVLLMLPFPRAAFPRAAFPRATDPHTIAFYGAMSGLGFAVAETGAYSVQYAIGLTRGQIDLGAYLATNTIRFVSLPLFHAVLTGIFGYFIGLAARYPSRRIFLTFIGLAIAAILHGLYNAFSGGLPGLGIIGFSILLFVAYLDRSATIMQHLEATEQPIQRQSR